MFHSTPVWLTAKQNKKKLDDITGKPQDQTKPRKLQVKEVISLYLWFSYVQLTT